MAFFLCGDPALAHRLGQCEGGAQVDVYEFVELLEWILLYWIGLDHAGVTADDIDATPQRFDCVEGMSDFVGAGAVGAKIGNALARGVNFGEYRLCLYIVDDVVDGDARIVSD